MNLFVHVCTKRANLIWPHSVILRKKLLLDIPAKEKMIIQAESKRVILLNFLKMFYESGTPRGGKTGENSKQDLNN